MTLPCPPVYLVPSSETVHQQMVSRFQSEDRFIVGPTAFETKVPQKRKIILLVGFEIQSSRRMEALLETFGRVRQNGGVIVGTTPGEPSALDYVRSDAIGLDGVIQYLPDNKKLHDACYRVYVRAGSRRIHASMRAGQEALQDGFAALRDEDEIDMATFEAAAISLLDSVKKSGVNRWVKSINRVDDHTAQHSLLVAGVTAGFLAKLGVGATDSTHLIRAALLHDAGKALIPDHILNKPGPLTDAERVIMQQHPVLGHASLRRQGDVSGMVLDVVLHHHEYLDGSGYPHGLKASQISDEVRIATICDIYTALIAPRPYKVALPPERALVVLSEMKGKLDPDLTHVFCDTFRVMDPNPSLSLSLPGGLC